MLSVLSVLALAATSANVAHAQSDPATDWANYEKLTLASGLAGEPIDMAVLPDGRVLHTQRAGALRLTTPASGVTEVVNQFNVYTAGEQGLLTVALDPDFATNQWVYVYYSPRLDTPGGNAPGTLPAGQTEAYWDQWKGYDVLSRFKWTGNSLDMASEQQIIKIDTNRGGSAHHAGDIAWDAQGNLFLSVGDNTSAGAGNAQGYAPINDSPGVNPAFDVRRASGNTNDLRGKILRIKVAADGSYTVPAGNLFPAGPKTRPEIYIMGLRNPYRMNIDKATNTLVWGEYAPDAGRDDARRGPMGLVEWNASPASGAPHNQGWPYCIANNRPYNNWDFVNGVSREWFDCNAPKNTSRHNTGLVDLPPVVPADMWYGDKNCKTTAPEDCDNPLWPELQRWSDNIEQAPMAGPIYNYDAANPSSTKFPAYWDGKAFFGEYSQDYLAAFTLTKPDGPVTKLEQFLPNSELGALDAPLWDGPMDLEFGNDGSLYVLEYGTRALSRVDYSPGNKRPRAVIATDRRSGGAAPLAVQFDATGSSDPENAALTYEWDFDGNGSWDATTAKASYTYQANGQYNARLRVTDAAGKSALQSVQITVGNTAPEINILTPVDGGFFDWAKAVIYNVEIFDPESTGAVACDRVKYTISIGHATHQHPFRQGQGCRVGAPVPPDAGHGETENIFMILEVSYTDAGANGVPAATGTKRVILNPKVMEGEHADTSSGVEFTDDVTASATRAVTSFDVGDWIGFDPVNFTNISSVVTRASGNGTLSLRWNSPTAQPFANVMVAPGLGWREVTSSLQNIVNPPSGTGKLYVTSSGGVTLDSLRFVGDGVADVTPPTAAGTLVPATPDGENGWYVTAPTFNVVGTDNGSIYHREYSVDGGVSWQQPGFSDQYDTTCGQRCFNGVALPVQGDLTVLFRVFDTSMNVSNIGSLRVKIDRTAPTVALEGLQDGKIGDSGTIKVMLSDFAPGSGGASIVSAKLDGTAFTGDSVDVSKLSLGTHTIVVEARDIAGNRTTKTETFTVTTSVADITALIDRFASAGRIPADAAAALRTLATRAGGSTGDARITALNELLAAARALTDADARTVLVRDVGQLLGEFDTTAPTVTAALTPGTPTGNNSWYVGPVTLNLTATDAGAIAAREYSLDGGATWLPTNDAGTATITQEGATTVRFRARDTGGNVSPVGTIVVQIDTRPAEVEFNDLVEGRIGNSKVLTPKATDPQPGSGDGSRDGLNNPGVLKLVLDGTEIPRHPIDLSTLSLGTHRLRVTVNDVAGNAAAYTLTFVVTTSFADFDAILDRHVEAGKVTQATATDLEDYLEIAKRAVDQGRPASAARYLRQLAAVVRSDVQDRTVRAALVRDAEGLATQVVDGLPSNAGTGVTSAPVERPQARPVVNPVRQEADPNAAYKVLVFTRTSGFRHNAIPDGIVAVQRLGREHGFNVDVYDPALPAVSLPSTPFTTAENLAQYRAVVFLNTGGSIMNDSERAALQGYIRAGGGYAGVHAAGDTLKDWEWYGKMVGAVFSNHPQGPLSTNPPCEPCFPGVTVTEDHSHPATEHLKTRWSVHDEFHNYRSSARAGSHVLMNLDESTYRTDLNMLTNTRWGNGYRGLMGDHPISWCQNFEGGRVWFQGLGHNREFFYDQDYLRMLVRGIQTAAGVLPANCTSHREVNELITLRLSDGTFSDAVAASLRSSLTAAQTKYMANDPVAAIATLQELRTAANAAISDREKRLAFTAKVNDLIEWMRAIRSGGGVPDEAAPPAEAAGKPSSVADGAAEPTTTGAQTTAANTAASGAEAPKPQTAAALRSVRIVQKGDRVSLQISSTGAGRLAIKARLEARNTRARSVAVKSSRVASSVVLPFKAKAIGDARRAGKARVVATVTLSSGDRKSTRTATLRIPVSR